MVSLLGWCTAQLLAAQHPCTCCHHGLARVTLCAAQSILTLPPGHKDYQEIWDGDTEGWDASDSSNMEVCKVR